MRMIQSARHWMAKSMRPNVNPEAPQQRLHYIELVNLALKQWQAAQSYFESVSDPELIEYAIYDLEASRRKYVYLLKHAEREMQKERGDGENGENGERFFS